MDDKKKKKKGKGKEGKKKGGKKKKATIEDPQTVEESAVEMAGKMNLFSSISFTI